MGGCEGSGASQPSALVHPGSYGCGEEGPGLVVHASPRSPRLPTMRTLVLGALSVATLSLTACNSTGSQDAPADGQEVEWIGPEGPEP